jgi:thiosulfate/3-mercaptopyruvate sulfurtransferase
VKKVMVMFIRPALVSLLLLTTLSTSPAWSQMQTSKLVSTEWLENNLKKENLRIIDVRSSIRDYWQNHIPGAVWLSPEALRLADHGVPGKLMPTDALAIMLGKMGVGRGTTVVVYDERNDFRPTYLIWALDYLAHPSALMLDGGFDKWQKEERSVTQDYPKIDPVDYDLTTMPDQEVRASLEEVEEAVKQNRAVILDVRPVELYTGEKGFWKRKGHIPGAINHFWGNDLNQDGSWKDIQQLRDSYEKLGATPDKTIITSCGQGQMSSHTYFTLKHILGYPRVKNYDGSFNEWSNVDSLPVDTGPRGK